MKIIFNRNKSFASFLIRLLTASRWHHCGVCFDDRAVYEASGIHGVRVTTLDEFKSRGEYQIVDINLPDEQSAFLWVRSQLGKKYDWSGIFSIIFQRKNWQKEDKWYCSEFAAKASEIGGLKLIRDGVNGVTPRDLWVQNIRDQKAGAEENHW